MDGVVKMSAANRRLACVQAEERLGLQAASIEKDFWVCWTLREVAGLPEIGEHLTFKGGTSPSKAWKLIDRRWAGRLRPSMRQVQHAGEKLFVDFSGKQPSVVDGKTGELVAVELFVGVLGASCYTYAEATATQKLHDWVGAHERMLEYFGGIPHLAR